MNENNDVDLDDRIIEGIRRASDFPVPMVFTTRVMDRIERIDKGPKVLPPIMKYILPTGIGVLAVAITLACVLLPFDVGSSLNSANGNALIVSVALLCGLVLTVEVACRHRT